MNKKIVALCALLIGLGAWAFADDAPKIGNAPTTRIQMWDGKDFSYGRLDESTHSLQVISHNLHHIYEGSHFFLDGAFDALGSGVTKSFGCEPSSGDTEVVMTFSIGGSGRLIFEMYEAESGSTLWQTGTGTVISPLNSDRNNHSTSSMTVTAMVGHGKSGVSNMIIRKIVGTSGANPAKEGAPGSGSKDAEIIFAKGKKYLVLFTSGAASNDINYTATWLEHTPRD